jgi:hypothetical protein
LGFLFSGYWGLWEFFSGSIFFTDDSRDMKLHSSLARIPLAPRLRGLIAHDLRGGLASAHEAPAVMLPGNVGKLAADEAWQDRQDDVGSTALAGSGGM